ncbi:hypothetical protein [Thalassotalea sp. ND16A]|uniref:hypothetical protein n=1 Tax=Thalassotalea sp. ND16A TaxID=1535422 RepID=UPI00051A650E|nr:hypothetical protein [Thalassotalea sp. ND16A]KGJ89966.1 lipoprotein [Thalassotalea sp. ND16A]
MKKIIICVAAAVILSACAGNNGAEEGTQLTKKSNASNCKKIKSTGSNIAKKVCSGGKQRSKKSD